MSNFLTRLAQRQLGQIRTVQPLVMPLLTPTNAIHGAPSIQSEQAEKHRRAAETASIENQPTTPPSTAPRILLAGNATAPRQTLDDPATPVVTRSVDRPVAEDPPAAPARRAETPKAPITVVAPSAPLLTEVPPAERADRSALRTASSTMQSSEGSMAAPQPLVRPGPIRDADDGAASDQLTAPVHLVSAASKSHAPSGHINHAKVQVTIGRVEVRANIPTPMPAARPPTPSKPTLSLGDYLKRGGGKS